LLDEVSKKNISIEKDDEDDQDAKQYISDGKEDLGGFEEDNNIENINMYVSEQEVSEGERSDRDNDHLPTLQTIIS
jgi:trehalose-6-phosphatase